MASQAPVPALPQQQQQQFGFGLGNSGGGQPPPDERQQDPPRGHYDERETDVLKTMHDAGTKGKHTLCLHCGKRSTPFHRRNWRACKDVCPLNPDRQHQHNGKLCPSILRICNGDWIFARTGESMAAEREAARDPTQAHRAEQRRAARQRASIDKRASMPPPQDHGFPRSDHSESFGRARESDFDASYIREQSPQRESFHTRGIEYRDRAPSLQHFRPTERPRSSQDSAASRLAAPRRDRAGSQYPPVVPTPTLQASPPQAQATPPAAQPDSSQAFQQLLAMYQQSQTALEQSRAALQEQTQRLSEVEQEVVELQRQLVQQNNLQAQQPRSDAQQQDFAETVEEQARAFVTGGSGRWPFRPTGPLRKPH